MSMLRLCSRALSRQPLLSRVVLSPFVSRSLVASRSRFSTSSISHPSDSGAASSSSHPLSPPPRSPSETANPADLDIALDDGSKRDSPKALGGIPINFDNSSAPEAEASTAAATSSSSSSSSSVSSSSTSSTSSSSSSTPSVPAVPSGGFTTAEQARTWLQSLALSGGTVTGARGGGAPSDDVLPFLRPPGASGTAAEEEVKAEEPSTTAMTPKQIVAELDKHIIGQKNAKRSVADALRNRYRRHKLPPELRNEVMPKNILMIGPTGVGKTEIARRMAKLTDAPFLKVEATKFTEVGFHGRDVDMIIHDLVQASIQHCRLKRRKKMKSQIDKAVEDRILTALIAPGGAADKAAFVNLLHSGMLENIFIEFDYVPKDTGDNPQGSGEHALFRSLSKVLGGGPRRAERKKMTIKDARPMIEEMEAERLTGSEDLVREAIKTAESDGIVFLDEIDKIVTPSDRKYYADASSEGVQRDLLPLVEGCTINTKFGNVETDHILFIASGAFHAVKPSDMLPELQGRLPIRVTLDALTENDLYRILTETQNNFIMQQKALLKTENVTLTFSDEAIREVARAAATANRNIENIGARRLHAVIERIMDELSFEASDLAGQEVVIDTEKVRKSLSDLLKNVDLSRYVL